jgi:hypothetical protein
MLVAPMLIDLINSEQLSKEILAAHCVHLKDRARNNAMKEAAPRIQDALKSL